MIAVAGAAVLLSLVGFGLYSVALDGQDAWIDGQGSLKAPPPRPQLDREAYDRKLRQLAHLTDEDGQSTPGAENVEPPPWPVTRAAYPEYGAILPFRRIVAYYGNFLSTSMGVLGEYPEEVMLEMLAEEVRTWEAADPTTPVQPAIDYIAIVAQAGAGRDGKYRARMPEEQLDKVLAVAAKIDAVVIFEVQAGLADLMGEVRSLEPYLAKPQVHLAIDPEFALRGSGAPPGTRVGTVDASEVNEAAEYLASLVRDNRLPPKVLVVHRYTRPMVTNAAQIAPLPEVQIVMDMDGWGPPAQKYASYESYISAEPVQFTGFKLFYKNDRKRPGSRLLTPEEILGLMPQPSFIQYQ
ncbi:hypothetical protein AMJ57_05040 [Parcubacteria bacterium SG8_24]|nr:MAG: hypothetical protein AMJ57_05040 [Parcubacteria bacterium SG8_24]